jgi:hypothetical protein
MSALPVKQPTTSSSQRQQIMKKHSKPRPVWDPDRTDIERPNELPEPSIDSVSRDDEAGSVEAAESVMRKATPFE